MLSCLVYGIILSRVSGRGLFIVRRLSTRPVIRSFLTAFSGTAVEFFETVVIAYAILRAGFPREAISATVIGHVLVFIAAIFLWPLHHLIPMFWLRLAAASLLTITGLYWAGKSLKRQLRGQRPRWVDDPLGKIGLSETPSAYAFSFFAFLVMFKSSLVEASEVLLVVFPIGAATGDWPGILLGAALAISGVTLIACLLHGHLKRIPEVKLKLAIGIILFAIGVSWLIELAPTKSPNQTTAANRGRSLCLACTVCERHF